jgi:hypothetical protein
VGIRHNVAAGIVDHAGSDGTLPGDESRLDRVILLQGAVTGYPGTLLASISSAEFICTRLSGACAAIVPMAFAGSSSAGPRAL